MRMVCFSLLNWISFPVDNSIPSNLSFEQAARTTRKSVQYISFFILSFHVTIHFPFGVFLFEGFPFVVFFLSAGEGDA